MENVAGTNRGCSLRLLWFDSTVPQNLFRNSSMAERVPVKHKVLGSSPSFGAHVLIVQLVGDKRFKISTVSVRIRLGIKTQLEANHENRMGCNRR